MKRVKTSSLKRAKDFIISYYKDTDDLRPYINNPFWTDNAKRMEKYKDQELSALKEKYTRLAIESSDIPTITED